MSIIKVSYSHPTWPTLRQTPGSAGIWGNHKFIFNQDIDECDAWVVINDLRKQRESTKCPPSRTLFVNEEPPTMKDYPDNFLSQFAVVATCGGYHWKHHAVREIFPLQAWYIGIDQRELHVPITKNSVRFTYDDFKTLLPPIKKKLLSIIYSDKLFTEGHIRRHEFVVALKAHFGDEFDIFGRGFRYVSDKWDAIADYKYHIVIENSSLPHYWTEKLADAFLGWSLPIYYGCPNINDYFSPDSFVSIDIESPRLSILKIEQIMKENLWKKNLPHIAEARRRILDEYNLFPMLIKLLDLPEKSEARETVSLKSRTVSVGQVRTMLQRTRTRLQFGLGITRIFPFLRKI